jgi:copper resistance protein B
MSTSRITLIAALLVVPATTAAAQIPAAKDQPTLGLEPGAMQPVMDQGIFAHALLNQNEGRLNGVDTQYRWSGQGWVGTDYDKLWIKSEGTVKGGKVEDGQDEFLYVRAITTYFDLRGGTDLDSRTRSGPRLNSGPGTAILRYRATGFVSSQGIWPRASRARPTSLRSG